MIETHPTVTESLSSHEMKLLPLLMEILSQHRGKSKAIKSFALCGLLNRHIEENRAAYSPRFKIAGARLRKMINHIRCRRLLRSIVGFESGYFIAEQREDLRAACNSLQARAEAIMAVRSALEQDYREFGADVIKSPQLFLFEC